jgi:hypothetical protein
MKQFKFTIFTLAILCFGFLSTQAQIKTPAPSPLCKVTQNVGLDQIMLEYSRPGAKGRAIFGDLVPYGEIWRTGANSPTNIEFSEDVTVAGKKVEAGRYAMYTIPGKDEWTVILNSDPSKQAWDREEAMDVASFKVKPEARQDHTETFTINIDHIGDDHAHVQLLWEKTAVAFKVEFEVEERVMKNINQVMAGPSSYEKYRAARYYFENDKDIEKAHQWISEACENDATFWMMKWKAEIEAAMGEYDMAIKTAEKSIELAKEAENKDYVKMNEENIAAWKKK